MDEKGRKKKEIRITKIICSIYLFGSWSNCANLHVASTWVPPHMVGSLGIRGKPKGKIKLKRKLKGKNIAS